MRLAEPVAYAHPPAPMTLEESGLSFELVTELVLKILHRATDLSGAEVGRRLGVSFPIIEASLDLLKQQRQCEITGGPSLGGPSFHYRLTTTGHTRAIEVLKHSQYAGVAPVPIEQYRRYMDEFQRSVPRTVSAERVRQAFSHLVLSEHVLDDIGPAVNVGKSIFIYGPPGNGKTIIARAIQTLLPGALAIPHALEVSGSIIRFYDPALHEPVHQPDSDTSLVRWDRRWISCRRPMIVVGGELTLDLLALAYNPQGGLYHAPVQTLANGGVLLVDDFGRQRFSPRDLLNWWMVPLETHFESLRLQSGERVEMPFQPLIIFSTNLRPSELVDEAFLRRIQYKIYAESPTFDQFIQIFELHCRQRDIPFEPDLVTDLVERFFKPRQIPFRACQPRDLIEQALSLAAYRELPRRLTADLLDAACRSYFIDDRGETRGTP